MMGMRRRTGGSSPYDGHQAAVVSVFGDGRVVPGDRWRGTAGFDSGRIFRS